MEARAEGIPPATASCYSAGLRVRVTPRAGLLQASRPADTGEVTCHRRMYAIDQGWSTAEHCSVMRQLLHHQRKQHT